MLMQFQKVQIIIITDYCSLKVSKWLLQGWFISSRDPRLGCAHRHMYAHNIVPKEH